MDLAERMTLTVKGQVTWANPELNKKCISCEHIQKVPASELNQYVLPGMTHRCALVKAHTHKRGVIFNASKAVACSMYKGA